MLMSCADGHDVAEAVIRRRYEGGLRNFWKFYQPLADKWAVYDNSGSSLPIMLAQGARNESDTVMDSDSWRQFREMSQ